MDSLDPLSPASALMTRRRFGFSVLAAVTAIGVAACSDEEPASTPEISSAPPDSAVSPASEVSAPTESAAASAPEASTTSPSAAGSDGFYDTSVLHNLVVAFDMDDYDAMIDAFVESGDKEWIEATVAIDGKEYRQVGMRLKGNSSLAGLGGATGGPGGFGGMASASADEPESLPWLIRLDKYIDDQHHNGDAEFVVRSNSSETAMNEAVSVALLDAAGMATQRATAVQFRLNDRPDRLRLVLENPNQEWTTARLGIGLLYKADASGDYSYRGEDADDYLEAWEQEAGDDDLTPLIEFLDFVNNSDDATFVAELGDHLDIEAFATYMAMEDLLQNSDDISGPGNNSYLYYDGSTDRMTVVAWDHNLALSGFGGGIGGPGEFDPSQLPGGTVPEGFDPSDIPGGTLPEGFDPSQLPGGGSVPEGFEPPGGGGGGLGGFGRANPLVDRFTEAPEFSALYDEALERLRTQLFESGTAQKVLDQWSSMLLANATQLVDAATIDNETAAIAEYFVTE